MDLRDKLIKLYERQIELQDDLIAQKDATIKKLDDEVKHLRLEKNTSPQWPPITPGPFWRETQPYGPIWTGTKPFDSGNITVSWNDEKEKQTQEGASS